MSLVTHVFLHGRIYERGSLLPTVILSERGAVCGSGVEAQDLAPVILHATSLTAESRFAGPFIR